jgi:hypothetical protein
VRPLACQSVQRTRRRSEGTTSSTLCQPQLERMRTYEKGCRRWLCTGVLRMHPVGDARALITPFRVSHR